MASLRMVHVLAVPQCEPVAVRGHVDHPAGLQLSPTGGQAVVQEVSQQEVAQVVDAEVELEFIYMLYGVYIYYISHQYTYMRYIHILNVVYHTSYQYI